MLPLLAFVAQAATQIQETNGAADIPQLYIVFRNFLNIAAALAGMVAVGVIILGGFKYIIARGDPKAIAAARSTIVWAIVGLFSLVVGYLILKLIEEITGIRVTQFSIPRF